MNKYISECIGTFALVFCGTGTIIVNEQYGANLGLFGIASAFGLISTCKFPDLHFLFIASSTFTKYLSQQRHFRIRGEFMDN